MLAGVQPFRAESVSGLLAKIVRGEYTPASTVADVPRELDLVLARALACDPGERYASAAQMLADIEQLQARLSADSGGTIREYYLQLFDGMNRLSSSLSRRSRIRPSRNLKRKSAAGGPKHCHPTDAVSAARASGR
jgi:serine/threonine protein kinase